MRSTQSFGPGSPHEPSPDEMEAWARRMGPPGNEVGWSVAITVVLGRGPDVAVAVTAMTAFTTGVAFDVAVRLRRKPDSIREHGLYQMISGRPLGRDADLDTQLLLGVEYADGRTAINTGGPDWPAGPGDETEPRLVPSGGGGSDLSVDQTFWLSPVPPDGPFTFVCSWQAFGIPETRQVVEHADLSQASSRALVLWPWEAPNNQPDAPRGQTCRKAAGSVTLPAVTATSSRSSRPGEQRRHRA